jgi:hypothetical protein
MKIFKLKKDGKVTHEAQSIDPNYQMEIPSGWGYIKEGWRTAQQLLELGLLQEGKPTREVIDRDSYEHIVVTNGVQVNGLPILEREKTSEEGVVYIEQYQVVPAVTHIEYWVDKNYEIVLEDDSAALKEEAEIAAAKKAISFGEEVIAMIWVRNSKKQLTSEQMLTIFQLYQPVIALLQTGSLATAYGLIQAASADGAIFTEEDRSAILAKIGSFS